ncbi:MAG: PDZ domain-containing protein [Calditrichaeota bacterium]|nr:MAG: PDZ domain-containing protein [Calditrichota bacterium]
MRKIVLSICLFLFPGLLYATPAIQNEIYQARENVMPALVHIQPVIKNFQTGEMEKQAVIGSGVIFHPDGYVVTNYHVAGKAERIICTLNDKEIVPATYIGGDPMTDISVIQLDLENYTGKIHIAEFGDSDSVQVGQYVMAMGSPLSLSRSISLGVISTKDRYFSSDVRLPSGERTGRYNLWLQTDAAINPGNSGGPLVDLNGKIVGINSRAQMFANNIGFAIPINIVKRVANEVIKNGKVTRSWIGLHCQPMQDLEGYFGTNRNSGVLISSIDADSPAEHAFLKAGDIVLKVNDTPVSARFVEELPLFYNMIAQYAPGTSIALEVKRNNEVFNFNVVTKKLGDLQGEDFECKDWGFTVKAITKQMQIDNQLEDTVGVYVVGVKNIGAGDGGGLRRRDVIKKVNETEIVEFTDFTSSYNQMVLEKKEKILLTINRGGATRYVLLDISDIEGMKTDG